MAQTGKESVCNEGDLGWEDPLKEDLCIHFCSYLENPDRQEHDGLKSIASQGVWHD